MHQATVTSASAKATSRIETQAKAVIARVDDGLPDWIQSNRSVLQFG